MSVDVPIERLRAAVEERGAGAYLLTVSGEGSPRAVHVSVGWEGDSLVAEVGKRSAANVAARPAVSLLYSVRSADDYSLIVDGTATVTLLGEKHRVSITPTKAVLHRPAVVPNPASPCVYDCVPLLPSTSRGGR